MLASTDAETLYNSTKCFLGAFEAAFLTFEPGKHVKPA